MVDRRKRSAGAGHDRRRVRAAAAVAVRAGLALAGLAAGAACGGSERTCGLTDGPEAACGEAQVCVCAVSRCARFDATCESQYRYAAGGCVPVAFQGTVRISTADDHPACSGGADADADADADDAGDVERDDAAADHPDDGADVATCLTAMDCTDDNSCNGFETCTAAGVCAAGAAPEDGAACNVPLPGHCGGGLCLADRCGDGYLDTFRGEECDDGNDVAGDGCEPDCRTTCLSGEPCHEDPDDVCTVDTCTALDPPNLGRLCTHEPAPPVEVCDYRDTDCDGEVDEGMTREVLAGPLRLTSTADESSTPSLAWNSANYLVAWFDRVAGGGTIWAARITAAGAPMGAPHRVESAGRGHGPALIWTPSAWAVAWLDERRGSGTVDARLAVLDTAAVRIGAEQLLTTAAARAAGLPTLAWDGLGLAVAWSDERLGAADSEIWFARAGADGTPDPAGETRVTDAPGVSREPALAWTGSSFLLAWIDGRDAAATGEEQILLATLDAAGAPSSAPVALTTAARGARDLRLAWSGSQLALVWTDQRSGTDQVYGRLVDAAGDGPAERPWTAVVDGASMPSVAWAGLEWGAAWRSVATDGADVVAAWYPPPGEPEEGRTIVSAAPGDARSPSLAWNGAGYGVAWSDDRDGNLEIYFALLGCP